MTFPWDSHLSRISINRMIPPKIAIHTTHVRGGTLNSPPFLAFLSSSLFLLSSDMLKKTGCASVTSLGGSRNDELIPSPAPLQETFCLRIQPKSFRNPQFLHPKDLSSGRRSNNKLLSCLFWNLLIHKKILNFDRFFHA